MGLEAVHRRFALVLDPMRLAVLLAGRGDKGGIDERPPLDPDRPGLELSGDGLEQRLVQPTGRQHLAEADEGGALRRRLVAGEAAEPTEGGPVVERLGELDVRQIVPNRKQHRLEQGQRRPGRLALGRIGDIGELPFDR